MLVAYTNDCFRKLYKSYPKISNFLPNQVMYRCYFLARSMLVFELVAIFAPEEISIDPFELFKTKGGLMFNAWCGPTGFAGEALFRFTA